MDSSLQMQGIKTQLENMKLQIDNIEIQNNNIMNQMMMNNSIGDQLFILAYKCFIPEFKLLKLQNICQ